MDDVFTEIQTLRGKQLNHFSRIVGLLGASAFAVSFFQSRSQFVLSLDASLFVLIFSVLFGARRLPDSIRAGIAVTVAYFIGLSGLISSGLTGFGLPGFLCFCAISSALLGIRAGIVASIISGLTLLVFGGCGYLGIIAFHL